MAFKILARLRFLRGTPFDPFGYTRERRVERQLIGEYEETIDSVIAHLTPETHAASVCLAALPLGIRGYGHVKEATIARARAEGAELAKSVLQRESAQITTPSI